MSKNENEEIIEIQLSIKIKPQTLVEILDSIKGRQRGRDYLDYGDYTTNFPSTNSPFGNLSSTCNDPELLKTLVLNTIRKEEEDKDKGKDKEE
jgi:hypothetical protein